MLACCAPSAIPPEFITRVCGNSFKKDVFIENVKYGSEKSRVVIHSDLRSLLTWISKLFEGPNTPSGKLIDYEAVQVASGYHDIFKGVCLPLEGRNSKYTPHNVINKFIHEMNMWLLDACTSL